MKLILYVPPIVIGLTLCLAAECILAQVQLVREDQVRFCTRECEGERDEYGWPVVPDNILERMKFVAIEAV